MGLAVGTAEEDTKKAELTNIRLQVRLFLHCLVAWHAYALGTRVTVYYVMVCYLPSVCQ